jgi:hypothetical protein
VYVIVVLSARNLPLSNANFIMVSPKQKNKKVIGIKIKMLTDMLSLYILSNSLLVELFIACVIFGNTAVAREMEKIEIGKRNIM